MKKQIHKFIIAAENLSSRSNKNDSKNDEIINAEKRVDKYKEVLEKIHKKFVVSAGSEQDKEKRIKKTHEYRLSQALDESYKVLPEEDLILRKVLKKCGDVQKKIANYTVEYDLQIENDVTKRLKGILDTDIQQITAQKRTFTRNVQEYNSVKRMHESAQRANENQQKVNNLRTEQEELEVKLEKERDILVAEMFALISKDEDIAYCVRDYVALQKSYYERALRDVDLFLHDINEIVENCDKKRIFGIHLCKHLRSTNRTISKVIELCVCCLIEKGLQEEGLLRVGCATTKLKRMKNALDAQCITTPLPAEYQDIHVIAGLLKLYLRELPEPLLTYKLYDDFLKAVQQPTENERKSSILNTLQQLPQENYVNLKYLMRFLWHIYQNQEYNKMSSQNIAIVMAPNILWPQNDSNQVDYIGQVSSTTAVNAIVELLVSEWSFFFDGDVDFYITIAPDKLFIDNGCIQASGISTERDGSLIMVDTVSQQFVPHKTHSRSSSHDTSRILLGSMDHSIMTRSQSNDSLSDNSSPTHPGSPKLQPRKKHNKPSAPTPPHKAHPPLIGSLVAGNVGVGEKDEISKKLSEQTKTMELNSLNTTLEQVPTAVVTPSSVNVMSSVSQKCDNFSQTPPLIVSSNMIARPDKPPRPAPVECHTLNRSTLKNRSAEKLSSSHRPVALPRTILNVAKSTENLSTQCDDSVQMRWDGREKPAIPERPITLARPTSFRNDSNNYFDTSNIIPENNGGASIKKASSFRYSNPGHTASTKNGNNNGTINNNNTNQNTNGNGNGQVTVNNHRTTLERAQFYSVDKKQVSIIDVPPSEDSSTQTLNTVNAPTVAAITVAPTYSATPTMSESTTLMTSSVLSSSQELLSGEFNYGQSGGQVPPSPRGFDPKIKRPQVPAPPPPSQRKTDGNLADTTHL